MKDPSGQAAGYKGYSTFSPNDASDYCAIGQAKNSNLILRFFFAASIANALFWNSAFPAILAAVKDKLIEKMNRPESNWKFFVWASALVAAFAGLVLVGANIYFLISGWSVPHVIFFGIAVGLSLVVNLLYIKIPYGIPIPHVIACCQRNPNTGNGGNPTGDTTRHKEKGVSVSTVEEKKQLLQADEKPSSYQGIDKEEKTTGADLLISTVKEKEKSLTGVGNTEVAVRRGLINPRPQENEANNCCRIICSLIVVYTVCCLSTLFLIFFTFHTTYIVIGAFADPVIVLSNYLVYLASLFSVFMFMALFMKYINKSNCDQNDCTQCCSVKDLYTYIPPVVSAFLFIAYVICNGLLFSFLMQNYRDNQNVLSILSTFLPSAILFVLGICSRLLINCVTKKKQTTANNTA